MKIGIEINNILRDLNSQLVKYYKKDIDKEFDDENIDYNVTDILPKLKFKNKKSKHEFVYIDYPYELFGCASATHRLVNVTLNNWLLGACSDEKIDVCLFSMKEEGLTIQSTYFFLSKIGSRVREVFFPRKKEEVWERCDVIVTNNKDLINSKPNNKIAILINNNDNAKFKKKCEFNYDSLYEMLIDSTLIEKIKNAMNKENDGILNKIKRFLKF